MGDRNCNDLCPEVYEYDEDDNRIFNPELPGPDWLCELIGVDCFASVVDVKLDERVTELEIRLTHLEDTIDVLNHTVIEQHELIDRLPGVAEVTAELARGGVGLIVSGYAYVRPEATLEILTVWVEKSA